MSRPEFFEDPYPFYARMREAGGVHRVGLGPDDVRSDLFLFSGYEGSAQLLRLAQGVSKNIQAIRPPGVVMLFDHQMMMRDGEEHTRLRRMIAGHFTPAALSEMEAFATGHAERLATALRERGGGDLVADFALPLPILVICEMMGGVVPDPMELRSWSLALSDAFDSLLPASDERRRVLAEASRGMASYLQRALLRPPGSGDTGIAGTLLRARASGELTDLEAMGTAALLLLAGHETTVSLISSALSLLLSHPDQWELLKRQPEHVRGAVEEALRFESPVQRTSFRITTEPVSVAGIEVPPGQQVAAVLGSANRDPEAFEQPDRFDITRAPNRHLAFGLGPYACIGMALARLEARIAIDAVIKHLPDVALTGEPPAWRKNSILRSLARLPAQVS